MGVADKIIEGIHKDEWSNVLNVSWLFPTCESGLGPWLLLILLPFFQYSYNLEMQHLKKNFPER